jgi:hypothetical protein
LPAEQIIDQPQHRPGPDRQQSGPQLSPCQQGHKPSGGIIGTMAIRPPGMQDAIATITHGAA